MDKIKLNINGLEVETVKGKSVLDAAIDADIYIPHLCHHPDLKPGGVCRLCIVEIDGIQGTPSSCTTPAENGMVVRTKTPKLDSIRRLTMELILSAHPVDCTTCQKYLNCELQSLKQYLETSESQRFRRLGKDRLIDKSNPLFVHDPGRCILCGRCVRACHEMRGVGILFFNKEGNLMRTGTAGNKSLIDAGCRFCGACAEVCPTGAIMDQEGLLTPGRSRREALVPCRSDCPAGIDVPRYIRFIREKNYRAALDVIKEKVPFPRVLGYVCNHPCEDVCRRRELNESIAIKKLKHFAAENDDQPAEQRSPNAPSTGKKVAVIGSGPAGLTAAYYLARLGHAVTVYESLAHAGGMLRVGIPVFRLPRDIIDSEIKKIENTGVEIKTNAKIESLDTLFDQGIDAVIAAVGAHNGIRLPIEGADLDGVLVNISFLHDVNTGREVRIGEKVIVLGGGSVAFDCALSALRSGAKDISIACLEAGEEMQAEDEDIEQARKEGIKILNSKNFIRIIGENGRVSGLECEDVECFEFDDEGRLNVECIPGSACVLPADTVIFAVGQRPIIPEGFQLNTVHGDLIELDEYTHTTSRDGVLAAGDAVTGTASVIKAIASGRQAAIAADQYLGGSGVIDEVLAPIEEPSPWLGCDEKFSKKHRCALQSEAQDWQDINPVPAYDDVSAVEEAGRCLQCDLRLRISSVKFWGNYSNT